MSDPTLDVLTNEVFESVVSYLELNDIRSLRLVNRATAYKATQDTFRSYFRTKHVDLTREDLETFVCRTSNGGLGVLVEDLVLVGIVYNPFALMSVVYSGVKWISSEENDPVRVTCSSEELQQAEKDLEVLNQRHKDDEDFRGHGTDVSLLTQALRNIVAHRPGGLNTLSLQVVVYRDDTTKGLPPRLGKCWRWNFEAASRTFILAMTCLRSAQLPVHTLDVFGKKPSSLSCNVPCDALSHLDSRQAEYAVCFKNVRVLAIGIADQVVNETEHDRQDSGDPAQEVPFELYNQKLGLTPIRGQIGDESNYSGLSRMLEMCCDLEDMDISRFAIRRKDAGLARLQESMLQLYVGYLARVPAWPYLRRLRLAGLVVRDKDLSTLLQNHSSTLRKIELGKITINQGSFRTVFEQLISEDMAIAEVTLEDLWEHGKLVHFEGEMERECTRISGDYGGRNILKQWGVDAKNRIGYHRYVGRAIGSGRVWKWRLRTREEFGGN